MKTIASLLGWLALAVGITLGWQGGSPQPQTKPAVIPWPAGLPVYDHIVIVIEENKDFEQIIGNPNAPYINQTLCK